MSQLIRMRQRIKAIKTIKKITHALRLISMSTHLRLRSKKNSVESYKETLADLFYHLQKSVPSWHHFLTKKTNDTKKPALTILVGSQKGLCGNFNSELFAFYEKETPLTIKQNTTFITIGKKTNDFVKLSNHPRTPSYEYFSFSSLEKISLAVTRSILKDHDLYSSITIYSSYSKSFFSQQPHKTTLIPLTLQPKAEKKQEPSEEYIWEQKPEEIINFLVERLLYMTIYEALFQSLVSEQAARFIAMDNSTRSASKLLESMQLTYNKMRQSKITGELTDLIGGFF